MIGLRAKIDRVRIKGFRSLADIEITELPDVTVMIGANGSGKSNFIRFFEMLSWMSRSRKLGEFVGRYGGLTISCLAVAGKRPAWKPR